ncbi:hypothetical protein AU195_17215 [Mycobacterium sp. IS-1496]|nr:hypothetical protein AU195_17215 [Mycobacterium sp. IS-1496]
MRVCTRRAAEFTAVCARSRTAVTELQTDLTLACQPRTNHFHPHRNLTDHDGTGGDDDGVRDSQST